MNETVLDELKKESYSEIYYFRNWVRYFDEGGLNNNNINTVALKKLLKDLFDDEEKKSVDELTDEILKESE